MKKSVIAIIMAGGLGKRMSSTIPKVIHKLDGTPLINHILTTLNKFNSINDSIYHIEKILVVVGKYKEQIKNAIENNGIQSQNITYVTQETPLGTGHAIMCCKEELDKYPDSDVLILSGDVPLLSLNTINKLLSVESSTKLVTANIVPPYGYGRIIIKNGIFEKIIEQKDCTEEEDKIQIVNAGIYCIQSNLICKYMNFIKNNNNQSEYYLTDLIEIIKTNENISVGMLEIDSSRLIEIMGVNTIQQLNQLEEILDFQKQLYVHKV
jgi:UDP-N-acetylglucosamine diphosphorylase/glucosamine-1-phosphate N-acetyltransferase